MEQVLESKVKKKNGMRSDLEEFVRAETRKRGGVVPLTGKERRGRDEVGKLQ